MSSFRDVIKIAAEWDGEFYREEVIRQFLDSVVSLMLSFT